MRPQGNAVARFNSLNLHDAVLQRISVLPSTDQCSGRVEIELIEFGTGTPLLLAITGCTNVSLVGDLDVLAQNSFASTDGVHAEAVPERIREAVEAQTPYWNVEYHPNPRAPIERKLRRITSLAIFRVRFYGATVEAIGTGYRFARGRTRRP